MKQRSRKTRVRVSCYQQAGIYCVFALFLVQGGCERPAGQDGLASPEHTSLATPFVDPTSETAVESQLVQVKVSQFHMGMMIHLTVWSTSTEQGQRACAAAFDRIEEINLIMSDYEPTSELSHLCRMAGKGPVAVSQELFEVLDAALHLAELSDGLFDPTAGPLVRLWRQARQKGQPPMPAAIEQALQRSGYKKLLLNAENQTVELIQAGMLLDLGSIAKGYAGDQAIRVLRQHGLTRMTYEAGGDKVLGTAPPNETAWRVELEDLETPAMRHANCAISISGDTVQFFEFEGKRFGHVIDPRTGQAIVSRRICITVASTGFISDPLATLGTIMPAARYERLLQRHFPDVQFQVCPPPADAVPSEPHIPLHF